MRGDQRLFDENSVEHVTIEAYAADDASAPVEVFDEGELQTGSIFGGAATVELPPGDYRLRAVLGDGSAGWWVDLLPTTNDEILEMFAHSGPHAFREFEDASIVHVSDEGVAEPGHGVVPIFPETSSLLGGVFSDSDDAVTAVIAPLDVGATMEVFPVGSDDVVASGVAGPSGVISVDGLAPGDYQVRLTGDRTVSPEVGSPYQETVSQWWPMETERSAAKTITVTEAGLHYVGVTANFTTEDFGTTEPGDRGTIQGEAAVDLPVELVPTPSLGGEGEDPVLIQRIRDYDLHMTKVSWRADGVPIPGAASKSLVIPPTAEGKALTAHFTSYILFGLFREDAETPPVEVGPSPFAPWLEQGVPTIAGDLVPGASLTATIPTWRPGANTKSFQWLRDGVPIADATKRTYKLTGADAGSRLSFAVTVVKPGYSTGYQVSDETDEVAIGAFTQTPVPKVKGPFRYANGNPLTVTTGTWKPAGTTDFAYEWFRDGEATGQNGAEYELSPDDVGATLTVRVTGSRPGYESVTLDSEPSTAILPGKITSDAVPTITGAAQVGQTLTTDGGQWSTVTGLVPDLSYEWLRAGDPIAGATAAQYTLTAADRNKVVKVRVTASLPGFTSVTKPSVGTAKVAQ
ncbi:hypothetical protein ET445_02875 [Agromyces protaetiae]|uniref:Uncharacterized protein n=1 Tax=Agromyces protaetiae TaxID=2509455 RepID=A0A4P6F8L8_9MICO|nr:hypothetical protein [Agromyces protaetiae]QAY72440.1 hypothetical protein ET445_02875 [Agromyces protaetiae]